MSSGGYKQRGKANPPSSFFLIQITIHPSQLFGQFPSSTVLSRTTTQLITMRQFPTSEERRTSFAPSPTRAPLTAVNLEAAASQSPHPDTFQGSSRMRSGRGQRPAAKGSVGSGTETLRTASDGLTEYEIPRGANWHANAVPRFNTVVNTNASIGAVGAGSLYRQRPTDGMTFGQLRDYWKTCVGENYAITAQQQRQQDQRDQLASALDSIMGGDPREAYDLASKLQSYFQGPVGQSVQQSAMPHFGAPTGIPGSIIRPSVPTITVIIVATPELAELFPQSMCGPSVRSQNTFAQARAPGLGRGRVRTLRDSDASDNTIYSKDPGFQAGGHGEPAPSRFKEGFNALKSRFKRSQAAPSTAVSPNAPRRVDPKLREAFSRFMSTYEGAPSPTCGASNAYTRQQTMEQQFGRPMRSVGY